MKPSIIIAGTLIFLDIVKELPATLVLRPLDIETLAISAYSFAADEELGLAAIPSLAMVAIVVPIVFFYENNCTQMDDKQFTNIFSATHPDMKLFDLMSFFVVDRIRHYSFSN